MSVKGNWLRRFIGSPDPAVRMLRGAAGLSGVFVLVHALGWRESTSVISGTIDSGNPTLQGAQAGIYVMLYFGFTLVSPILALAAGFMAVGRRAFGSQRPGGH